MTVVVVLCRLALALAFVVSAAAKATDPAGTRTAARDLGVPARFTAVVAVLLPVAELTSAALLLAPPPYAIVGAALSLALLAAFSVAIARVLQAGTVAHCRCFGGLSSKPLSRRSLLRNAGLGALAVVGALRAGDAAVLGSGRPGSGLVWGASAAGLVIAGLAGALVVVLRRYGAALGRLEALEQGGALLDEAPAFTLPDLTGRDVSLADLLAPGVPVLLLFMSPTCRPCHALAPRVGAWHRRYGAGLTVAVISDGEVAANREEFPDPTLTVLLETGAAVSGAYAPDGTPAAVVLLPDGRRLSAPAYGADEIGELVQSLTLDRMAGEAELHMPMLLGQPLPTATAPDLDGNEVDVAAAAPGRSVLLFWSTTCSFAARIADDVLAWERASGPADPGLVVLSGGPRSQVRKLGFRGPVLLDPHLHVGNAYGVDGTPSAFVIENGRLASEIAEGATEVLALLAAERSALAPLS